MQIPDGMPAYFNRPHTAESNTLLYPSQLIQDVDMKRNILSELEITHNVDDELYGARKKFVVRVYNIPKQEYIMHNRRNLKWLPWGKYHKYRIASIFLREGLNHKLFMAMKKKMPAFKVRLASDAWTHFYQGYAEIYDTINARFAISRTLLGVRFPRVYAFLRNSKWSKSFYMSLVQV